MSSPPADRCGCTWPRDHDENGVPRQDSCCWRETAPNADRCVWHADTQTVTKSVERLRTSRAPRSVRTRNAPYAELLDGVTLAGLDLGSLRAVTVDGDFTFGGAQAGAVDNAPRIMDLVTPDGVTQSEALEYDGSTRATLPFVLL
ncbi:hypothetical protein BRC64_11355 [Halobacteriales archaeon QH_10_67_22]|nr:MAG: hypothetical protein BRC64_11355 [Halobacteriales archaeon QH_10_67_22]